MKKLEPVRQWLSADGIRCAEVSNPELAGETMIDARDLAKFLLSIDTSLVADPEKRFALQRFQRDVSVLGPATAHRRAVELLEQFGGVVPDELRRPFMRVVTDGAK